MFLSQGSKQNLTSNLRIQNEINPFFRNTSLCASMSHLTLVLYSPYNLKPWSSFGKKKSGNRDRSDKELINGFHNI